MRKVVPSLLIASVICFVGHAGSAAEEVSFDPPVDTVMSNAWVHDGSECRFMHRGGNGTEGARNCENVGNTHLQGTNGIGVVFVGPWRFIIGGWHPSYDPAVSGAVSSGNINFDARIKTAPINTQGNPFATSIQVRALVATGTSTFSPRFYVSEDYATLSCSTSSCDPSFTNVDIDFSSASDFFEVKDATIPNPPVRPDFSASAPSMVFGFAIDNALPEPPDCDPGLGMSDAWCPSTISTTFEIDNFDLLVKTPADTDGDGTLDPDDNCLTLKNGPGAYESGLAAVSQCDRDSDGYGNACDGDFNQDGFVTPLDTASYQAALMLFIPPPPGQHDMNCDGFMTPGDNSFYTDQLMNFFVGPSGLDCAGVTIPCPPAP